MNDYILMADSACDISTATLKTWGVRSLPLTFAFGEEAEMTNEDMTTAEFYRRMRAGEVAHTAAINRALLEEAMEEELAAGRDVLYIVFSSGLSTTFQTAALVAGELAERYPARRVEAVDSLAASAGYGLLLFLASREKEAGKTLDEVADFVKKTRLSVCHWFTVDTLTYLKRGGRVSAATAFVGNLLDIRPVLHVDDEGHLIPMQKVRGRKASIRAIVNKYGALAKAGAPVFLSHGDCAEDAQALADALKENYGVTVNHIDDIGPVIGAHSGPGTLALFFLTEGKR